MSDGISMMTLFKLLAAMHDLFNINHDHVK